MGHCRKQMLSFFLTTKCNLNCSYCYAQSDRQDERLSLEFAATGIDHFINEEGYSHIRFSGAGEPTLEFDLMREIWEYSKRVAPFEITSELQTNGCFDLEVAAWLCESIDIMWISCDGMPDIQDKYRPMAGNQRSSALIERNIEFLRRKGKVNIGIRATITAENLCRQNEILEYFNSLGIKYVWSDPIFSSVYDQSRDTTSIDTFEYAQYFLEAQATADSYGMIYGSILTCNFDEEIKYHCRSCLPAPHLTTDGYISACDMALFGKSPFEHMDIFVYGKWDSVNNTLVFDDKKIELLRNRSVDNIGECKDCVARYHCGGYCLGEVVNEFKKLYTNKPEVCEAIRFLLVNYKPPKEGYIYLHP